MIHNVTSSHSRSRSRSRRPFLPAASTQSSGGRESHGLTAAAELLRDVPEHRRPEPIRAVGRPALCAALSDLDRGLMLQVGGVRVRTGLCCPGTVTSLQAQRQRTRPGPAERSASEVERETRGCGRGVGSRLWQGGGARATCWRGEREIQSMVQKREKKEEGASSMVRQW